MILVCNVGKHRLYTGQPFLASCWLEPEWTDYAGEQLIKGGRIITEESPAVLMRNCETGDNFPLPSIVESVPPGIFAGDTSSLPEGAYEVLVALAAKETWLPEALWVLNRETYRDLLIEEANEEFGQAPNISTRAELTGLMNEIVRSGWDGMNLHIETSFTSAIPIAAAPIDWITRTVLDTFRYVAVFGVNEGTVFAAIRGEQVEIGVQAQIEYEPPRAVLNSLYDEKVSDLYLLNAAGDIVDFDVELVIERLAARIAIRQSLPQLITV